MLNSGIYNFIIVTFYFLDMDGFRYYLKRDSLSRMYLVVSAVDGKPKWDLFPTQEVCIYDAFGVPELYLEGVLAYMFVNNGRVGVLEDIWSWGDEVGLDSVAEKTVLIQSILDTAYSWIDKAGPFKVTQDMVEDYVMKVFKHFKDSIEGVLSKLSNGDIHLLFQDDGEPTLFLSIFRDERFSIVHNLLETWGTCSYSSDFFGDDRVVLAPYEVSSVIFFHLLGEGYRFVPLGYDTINLDEWLDYLRSNGEFILSCAEVSFLYWSRLICDAWNYLMKDWCKCSAIHLPSIPFSLKEQRPRYSSHLSIREVLEGGVDLDELNVLKRLLGRGYSCDGGVYLLGMRNPSYGDKVVDKSDVSVIYTIFWVDPDKGVLQYIDLETLQKTILDRFESVRVDDLWVRINEVKYPSIKFCILVVRNLDAIGDLDLWEEGQLDVVPSHIKEVFKDYLV